MAIFEQPLNERIRTFIRLQQLFDRIRHHAGAASEWDVHAAVLLLLDLYEITARLDLKSEVMKELERQSQSLGQFSGSSEIDNTQLNEVLNKQREFVEALHEQKGQITQHIKNNEFLNNVRQRCAASGSACSHDLPVYYYWLNLPPDQCNATINDWLKPYEPALLAIDLVLDTIRQSTGFETKNTSDGFYQQALSSMRAPQLIRARTEERIFPEISGSKHRMSIRFFRYVSVNHDSSQVTDDVTFELALCTI